MRKTTPKQKWTIIDDIGDADGNGPQTGMRSEAHPLSTMPRRPFAAAINKIEADQRMGSHRCAHRRAGSEAHPSRRRSRLYLRGLRAAHRRTPRSRRKIAARRPVGAGRQQPADRGRYASRDDAVVHRDMAVPMCCRRRSGFPVRPFTTVMGMRWFSMRCGSPWHPRRR